MLWAALWAGPDTGLHGGLPVSGGGGPWASGWLTRVGDCFVPLLKPYSVPSNQINVNLILVVSLGSACAWHFVVLAFVQHLHSFCSLYLWCEPGVRWRFMGWGGSPGLHLLWWDFGSTDIGCDATRRILPFEGTPKAAPLWWAVPCPSWWSVSSQPILLYRRECQCCVLRQMLQKKKKIILKTIRKQHKIKVLMPKNYGFSNKKQNAIVWLKRKTRHYYSSNEQQDFTEAKSLAGFSEMLDQTIPSLQDICLSRALEGAVIVYFGSNFIGCLGRTFIECHVMF